MKFFALTTYIKYIVRLEEQDGENDESSPSMYSGLLSSNTSLKLALPVLATLAVPAYSYLRSRLDSQETSSKLGKLSTIIDDLTKDNPSVSSPRLPEESSTWDIPKTITNDSASSVERKSPAALGLKGSLPDNGTYTKQEADYILGLRSQSIDTTASKTRMHPSIEALIRAKAAEYGVDPDIAVKIAVVESGGNPNAISSTGAIGVYQFTGATASLMGLSNRFNIADNIDAGIRLIVADKKFVGKFNSDVATYLALQIGGPNAKYVLSVDPSTSISELPTRIRNTVTRNLGGSSSTVGEYISANALALEAKVRQQKSKPEYVYVSPVPKPSVRSSSSSTLVSHSNKIPSPTSVVRETRPTSTPPNYTKLGLTSPDVHVDAFNSPYAAEASAPSAVSNQPIQSVVRHKSGLYFNTG